MASSFDSEIEAIEFENLSSLAENLVYRLPGCSDLMIRKTIQDVYREFCKETKCLTTDRIIELEDGETDYVVGPRFGGIVGEVREAWIGNLRLIVGRDYQVFDSGAKIIRLRTSLVDIPDNVPLTEEHLYNETRTMRVKATEFPKMSSERVPSWFIEKHGEAVCSGVLSRLMAMTGKAWTDAQQAADERRNYENAKSEARMFEEVPMGGRFIDTSMVL